MKRKSKAPITEVSSISKQKKTTNLAWKKRNIIITGTLWMSTSLLMAYLIRFILPDANKVFYERNILEQLNLKEQNVLGTENSVRNEEQQLYPPERITPIETVYKKDVYPLDPPPKSTEDSVGPGEHGAGFLVERELLSKSEKKEFDDGWNDNAFNQFASDRISVRRHLPDIREGTCLTNKYPNDLPVTAVVICFFNECWSTLLRSVHSVLDNSPSHLLKEIILVDDCSNKTYLKTTLDNYMEKLKKVRVIHLNKREGLIRARMIGMNATTAKIITFLDSHIECTPGWLEPLLARIHENSSNVVSPVIDRIMDDVFAYMPLRAEEVQVGGFDWDLTFDWHIPPMRDLKRPGAPYSPIRTPTIAGGLFAIHRDFFADLGFYDPGMEVWGAENLEISFKTWMCGGTLEVVVCSHIGHVFRTRNPYLSEESEANPLRRNMIRLAEVWMDDFRYYFYDRFYFQLGEYGNVSDRRAIRDRLKCRSFSWYLDNVYPELFVPSKAKASGDIECFAKPFCADASTDPNRKYLHHLQPYPCHKQGGHQFWFLSEQNEIRRDKMCWTVNSDYESINMTNCHNQGVNQEFIFTQDNLIKNNGRCLELSIDYKQLTLKPCSGILRQKWKFARKSVSPPRVTTYPMPPELAAKTGPASAVKA